MNAAVVTSRPSDPTGDELLALQREVGAIFARWRDRSGPEGILRTERFRFMVEAEVALGKAAQAVPTTSTTLVTASPAAPASGAERTPRRCSRCRALGHRIESCPVRRTEAAR